MMRNGMLFTVNVMKPISRHLVVAGLALLIGLQSSASPRRTVGARETPANATAPVASLPAGDLQIQSRNLRIEFDRNLRSRVVARLDGKEVVLGPFTASETAQGAKRKWRDFPLISRQPGELFRINPRLPELRRSDAASWLDHQARQQDRAPPARAGRGQSAPFRRRDADVVQADQEASRGKDCPRGRDATSGHDSLAHAQEEREVPLRRADPKAPGI